MRRLIGFFLAFVWVCVGGASAAPVPAPAPMLLVLCEHFDCICPYRVEGGRLVSAAPPTVVAAPHDALWNPTCRRLYVSAEYKGRPCIISYQVTPDGVLKRVGDPVPTRDRGPALLLLGLERPVLCAATRGCVQTFPLDASGQPGPPVGEDAGVDAWARIDATHVAVLRAGGVQLFAAGGPFGAWTPCGPPVDGGAGAVALAADVDGRTLFVLNMEDFTHHLRRLDVRADGLRLSAAPAAVTATEAQKRLVATSSRVYLVNASDTITAYARDGDVLVPVGRPTPTAMGLADLLPDGAVVHAVGAGDAAVCTHVVSPKDGTLRRARREPLPGGAAGTRLLLLPDGP